MTPCDRRHIRSEYRHTTRKHRSVSTQHTHTNKTYDTLTMLYWPFLKDMNCGLVASLGRDVLFAEPRSLAIIVTLGATVSCQ